MPDHSNVYLAVDFDGTIVTHKFPDIGEPVPGALEWLKKFQEMGFKIILNTMRSDGRKYEGNVLTDAVNYLRVNGIELYGINHNPDQDEWTTSPKVYGHYYIDDAAVGCPLIYPSTIFGADLQERPYVDWEKVGQEIMSKLEVGWKKSH